MSQLSTHYNRYTKKIDIVALGETTLFVLSEHGKIRYQRRLDFTPSCIQTYHLKQTGADIYEDDYRKRGQVMNEARDNSLLQTPCFMMILGSFNNFLMMYKDVRLVWAARTVTTPVFV